MELFEENVCFEDTKDKKTQKMYDFHRFSCYRNTFCDGDGAMECASL